jgi:cell pole-organizing protein PopZ
VNDKTQLTTQGQPGFSLLPQTFDQAMKFAELLAASDMVPKDFKGKAGNCLIAVQWGFELGLQPLQAIQNIAVINGRPSLWGDLGLAIVMRHPEYEGHYEEQDDTSATCVLKRRGMPEIKRTFTQADAKTARLWGKEGPWTNYPKRMMQMRARWWAIRDLFPDALKGMVSAEEAQDERDVTAEGETLGAATEGQPDGQAQTRVGKLKDKLKSKAHDTPPALPAPTLEEVLNAIAAATDRATMEQAKALGEKLKDEADLTTAVTAYGEKLKQLKAKAAPPPPAHTTTGELPLEAGAAPEHTSGGEPTGQEESNGTVTYTFDQIAEFLKRSKNLGELDVAADLIQTVPGADAQSRLSSIYKMTRKALEAQPE